MSPRRTRVLHALQRATEQGDGWVCARSLMHPQLGVNRFGARLHELRRDGVVLERRVCACEQCRWQADQARRRGGAPTCLHAWRIAPEQATDTRRTA